MPAGLDALDARPLDIAVLAFEGVGVGHDEVDQLVDVVAKGRQRERLPFADPLALAELEARGLLGLEIRVAAEAVEIGRIRRAERGAGRGDSERVVPPNAKPYSAFQVAWPPKVS